MNDSAPAAPVQQHANTGLAWGLKSSFLDYLGRMPGSQSVVRNGAGTMPTGEYYFELADDSGFDRGSGLGIVKFRGEVRFAAHHGMLVVSIADPWVDFGADAVILSIVDGDARLPLAALSPVVPTVAGDIVTWSAMPSSLTAEGVEVFNDVYPADEPFDPVNIRIGVPVTNALR